MQKLLKCLEDSSGKNPSFSNFKQMFAEYLCREELSEDACKKVIEKLCCSVLMDPEYAQHVAECFPQYLILLLSMIMSTEVDEFGSGELDVQMHRLNCVILGQLIAANQDVLSFSMRYFETHPAPFESPTVSSPPKKRKLDRSTFEIKHVSDYDIVVATYKILNASPSHFKHKWNWSQFYNFLIHDNNELRWIALKSIAIVLNMSELTMIRCAKVLIPDFNNFLLDRQSAQIEPALMTDDHIIEDLENLIKDSESLVSIAGVLLPVFKKTLASTTTLIPVPSMTSNLRSLALAVASRKCVCLQGPVGCGKTALVEYLAKITGRGPSDFIKVQLGDQTDSKMLLGTYRCTDNPGEFVWQPGVLTQAVLSGKWLLLEDIDSAALDVSSVLSNLMETSTLSVPGYRDTIHVTSGFQLFVTQRLISSVSGLHRQSTSASNLLEKHWLCVYMNPLTKDELTTVVKTLFPSLSTIATRIIDVFLMFSMGSHDDSAINDRDLFSTSGRLISTRDLIKWCNRIIVDYDVSSPESAMNVLKDAFDIFCCSLPDHQKRLDRAATIAPALGIVKTRAIDTFSNIFHKTPISIEPELFIAGRAKLERKIDRFVRFDQTKVNFTFTRPSASLLERVACCVIQKEPILLVGETGTGKTSVVQFLARSTGHKLVIINMNQQSETADLLGGYKPVDIKILITPIREEFETLFRSYYAVEPNRKFLEHVANSYKHGKWKVLVSLMLHSTLAAIKRLRGAEEKLKVRSKRKNDDEVNKERLNKWEKILTKLEKLKGQVKTEFSLAFAFVEGCLIKALQQGYWVLLDEINLASSETLECLSGLLEGSSGSLSLIERGDSESIKRHKDFTIFACMNPATDVGKKELPVGLRNRFTEFFVDELTEPKDLHFLINSYLENLNLPPTKIESIVNFYLKVRKEATNSLNDGTGHKPHYSLRTLCRALSIAATNPCGTVLRSLYEAFCLSFLTQLDHQSYPVVQKMITQVILDPKNMKSILSTSIAKPTCSVDEDYINFEGYWVTKGTLEPEIPNNYILTSSVRRNLKDLARVVSIGKMPVLLQGDTSVGKTSLITYLAKASGHVCVRINNHEHTDLQEYVGNYVASDTGKLVFKEGVLVEAMRKGYWIILDELNLAPSDVLEALNRVLDDNRELFIPETQQVVKAHCNFMLFATQNPPGLYGGRKVLSRAFRNRFVELHFSEIPADELQVILHKRCNMPESYCKQIINVMTELQIRRKSTAAFMGKQGFITLRDLFRWGERYRLAPNTEKLYDWSQHLADEGYLVLAAKVRRTEEAEEIREVIKKHLKRDVDPENLFSLHDKTSSVTRPILERILKKSFPEFRHIVWTYHMRRMAVLVAKSCEFKEPVLLVGETGGGKTTVCQLIAAMRSKKLYGVNCHMHTESSDFLGNLRPVRDHTTNDKKLFEWVDGPLIEAMRNGDVFLADEISLADDSVLERMNSVLEPERSLLLAEKNTDSIDSKESDCVITAHNDFCFIGTMNPGGDFGKKELSPALRNRFTEIWCEGCVSDYDLQQIINHNLNSSLKEQSVVIAEGILHFLNCLKVSEIGQKFTVSIRDVLTWVNFFNITQNSSNSLLSIDMSFIEGARLTYLDSLGSGVTSTENKEKLEAFKTFMLQALETYVIKLKNNDATTTTTCYAGVKKMDDKFGIPPYFIDVGPNGKCINVNFAFDAPTTQSNTLKILRSLQLKKPLLLEGSPGVGKTSLVSAIAKSSGHNFLRINLSDQTDVSDLFGADLPVEGGMGGQFAWKDGPFLRALRAGDWILLDELNLASQSVLEGLNACLDHRGEIYIPELGRTFDVKPGTKLFACQNPLNQGGARRGLPKSFLNRFTQVFIDALSDDDLKIITRQQFPDLDSDLIDKIVKFNAIMAMEAGISWAYSGAPWEMNLRDITRWCELICKASETTNAVAATTTTAAAAEAVELIYADRMRNVDDKEKVGGPGTGKSSVVRVLAQLAGQKLRSIVVNSAMDTTEILGSFEQTDYNRHLEELIERTEKVLIEALRVRLNKKSLEQVSEFHRSLEKIRHLSSDESLSTTMAIETETFLKRTKELLMLISAMETLESSENAELASIKDKLKNLSNLVKRDKCLNAGGKFEWVNSVLVKCLQDGTWLLVDQVNLCSPAVLDRLNGLLEPGGVLTIGERGVNNEGRIYTIKPHENFRLFLTMDPYYGEISRAMRNRGVEIFFLGHKPNSYDKPNDLDIKSLMYNVGLTRNNHQETLLNIHRKILSQELLTDKLSPIQLLQCAFLITQQISRGFSVRRAFTTACIDVYIKSRYILQPDCKNRLISIIDDTIDKFAVNQSVSPVINLFSVTWNIRQLQENCSSTIISQQGTLLSALINKYRGNNSATMTTKFLNDYLNCRAENSLDSSIEIIELTIENCRSEDKNSAIFIDVEIPRIIPYLLLTFFEKSSIKDISLRSAWLNKFICNSSAASDEFLSSFKEKISDATEEILNTSQMFNDPRPWYHFEPQNITQRLCLKLYMKLTAINHPEKMPKSKNIITVKDYSNRICNYHLQADDNVIPLVTHFIPFISAINRAINDYIDNLSECNHAKYIEIRRRIQWFRRFSKQGHLTFVNKSQKGTNVAEYTEMLLIVHYQWLKKLFLNDFDELKSPNSDPKNNDKDQTMTENLAENEETTKLRRMIAEFDNHIHYQNSYKKLAKKIKSQLKIIRPFTAEKIINGYKKLFSLTNNTFLPLNTLINYQLNLILTQTENFTKIHIDLSHSWEDIYHDKLNESLLNNVLIKNEQFRNEYGLELRANNVNSICKKLLCRHSKDDLIAKSMNVKLWSLYEYGFMLVVHTIHRQVSEKLYSPDLNNQQQSEIYLPNVVNNFSRVFNIPPNLSAILEVITSKRCDKDDRERLLPELFRNLTQYRGNYQCCNTENFISYLNSLLDDDDDDDTEQINPFNEFPELNDSKFNYSDNNPVLITTLSLLLLTKYDNKNDNCVITTAPLGLYKIHLEQMNIINDTLWRNTIVFNSDKFNHVKNDHKSLLFYINRYLNAIEEVEKNSNIYELIVNNSDSNQNNQQLYETCYKTPLKKLKSVRDRLKSAEIGNSNAADRGLAWIYLGFHQVFLFSHLGFIDPVLKTELKLQYINEDIEDLEILIYSNSLDSFLMDDDGWIGRGNPSRLTEAKKCLQNLCNRHDELKKSAGYRSSEISFAELTKKVACFRGDVGSPEFIINSGEKIHQIISDHAKNDDRNSKFLQSARQISEVLQNRQNTWNSVLTLLETKFLANYRELVSPIIKGLTEIIHGADILVAENNRLIAETETQINSVTAENFVSKFVQFPTIGFAQPDLLQLIDLFSSQQGREFIKTHLDKKDKFVSLKELFRLMKNALHELCNYVTVKRQLTKDLWDLLNSLLGQIVLIWQKQRIEREKVAAESESLYKGNVNIHGQMLTEEQEINEQLRHLFPRQRDQDFIDIEEDKQSHLEHGTKEVNYVDDLQSCTELITEDDFHQVYELHSRIVKSFVPALWIKSCQSLIKRNYVEPLIQRYHTFALLRSELEKSLSKQLSNKLHISFNILSSIAVSINSGERNDVFNSDKTLEKKYYDFYKSSNIEEVKQCIPILRNLINKIEDFLKQWPEHPTLLSIRTIITRINGFPITSSVSRFLTGLELLCNKTREWEENAHSGVSLQEFSAPMTQQVINWRKLELNCWKDCLNSTFERLKIKASKWWFFIYSLVDSFVNKTVLNELPAEYSSSVDFSSDEEDQQITSKKLIELLENFISQSNLVEFQTRLDLLLTFHTHVFYLNSSSERDELLAIFWNIYQYYSQFSNDVSIKINAIKLPIEKKLRDFVKIARWNDINYWSVKTAVEKSHRTLLKFIREYEVGLNQNVSACLTIKPENNSFNLSSEHQTFVFDPNSYSITDQFQKIDEGKIHGLEDSSLIERSSALLKKSRKLCKEIFLLSTYPGLRSEMGELIDEFMERSIGLKNMEIDQTLAKPKQKSLAKSILQQKKMALADYFKTLTKIGVSYRKGSSMWQNKQQDFIDMTMPPLDISNAFHKFKCANKVDQQILEHWNGCDKYFYKSCILLNALNSTFTKISTDLGPQNMERCRGFSIHILLMIQRQKELLAKSIDEYVTLRKQVIALENFEIERDVNLPSYEDIYRCADELNQLSATLLIGFEQIDVYLQSCPQECNFELKEKVIMLESSDIVMLNATKNDVNWKRADDLIKNVIKLVNSCVSIYDKWFSDTPVVLLRTAVHLNLLHECCKNVKKIVEFIDAFEAMFANESERNHPILMTLEFLKVQVSNWIRKFEGIKILESNNESSSTELSNVVVEEEEKEEDGVKIKVNELIKKILLVIQEKYKEAAAVQGDESLDDESKENKKLDESEKNAGYDKEISQLEDNGFREKLIESLEKDIKKLQLAELNKKFDHLLEEMLTSNTIHSTVFKKIHPILKQFLLFTQFYLTEQVAVFRVTCKILYLQLNVFLDLATRGFCVPKDLDLDDAETDEGGIERDTDKGGMGLSEGEGKKDVSDRIESEDQLEDARPAGEEREEKEDKDCKEEEGGIEMSENFDSKLQDVEEKEKEEGEEENEDDDDDEELDKEMGETERGADQLDEEIWKDDADDEADDENDDNDNTEEQGKGEKLGDKEMSAKDDSKTQKKDDEETDDRANKEKEKEQKEINEMDEPDVNDDQIDPYHGKQNPQPEVEPMDLPEDLNLDGDDDEAKDEQAESAENPFDIDEMKEAAPPGEDVDKEEKKDEGEKTNDEENEDSSDEDDGEGGKDIDVKDLDDEESKEPEESGQQAPGDELEDPDKQEDKKEDKEEDKGEQAVPSADDGSKETDAAEQVEDKLDGSKDKVANQEDDDKRKEGQEVGEKNDEDDGNDKGTGQAQSQEQSEGHTGAGVQRNAAVQQKREQKTLEKRKNPGESDENRALVDDSRPDRKKQRMIQSRQELEHEETGEEGLDEKSGDVDMCQHVKESEKFDDCAIDAATEDQVKKQKIAEENEEKDGENDKEIDVDMQVDEEAQETCIDDIKQVNSESMEDKDKNRKKSEQKNKNAGDEEVSCNADNQVDVEGEVVPTTSVSRPIESAFYTKNIAEMDLVESFSTIERKRREVEQMLSQWTYAPSSQEALTAWNCLSAVTETPARDLSEKLRLVLEPTQASRLKGDYRTGKRINMRKIIPYIASQFRKDKIWLRRTKPSKRDYQIVLAIDDSSSMADNHSKELAFESLSLISKAMSYLEVGQLSVISFGERPRVLHPLGEPFNEQSGARLIQEMRFDQKKTMIGQLVDFTVDMFDSNISSRDNAKLVVVLSDGRGVFSEGSDYINRAVRRAKLADIFLVFIIVENPLNKDSILDIRMPVFESGKLLGIRSYMDSFPFPFYMILRDINAMPGVLSDALRQWFEVVGKIDT